MIVTGADRPAKRPFAHLFPKDYPEDLSEILAMIEWRQRLARRWPKATFELHSLSDDDGSWRRQLEHAERWIAEREGRGAGPG